METVKLILTSKEVVVQIENIGLDNLWQLPWIRKCQLGQEDVKRLTFHFLGIVLTTIVAQRNVYPHTETCLSSTRILR
jgi:hypothetical protein